MRVWIDNWNSENLGFCQEEIWETRVPEIWGIWPRRPAVREIRVSVTSEDHHYRQQIPYLRHHTLLIAVTITTIMMEMGQQLYNDAGGGGALPPSSSNSNSLQFSPQSALTSNENLFLLDDPDFSTYSTDAPMEPFHIPSFSVVFMDHYSANLQGNSNFLEGFHQVSPVRFPSSNRGFYAPTDEGSGTSTNSIQGGHGNLNNITSVNSQVHSLTNPSYAWQNTDWHTNFRQM